MHRWLRSDAHAGCGRIAARASVSLIGTLRHGLRDIQALCAAPVLLLASAPRLRRWPHHTLLLAASFCHRFLLRRGHVNSIPAHPPPPLDEDPTQGAPGGLLSKSLDRPQPCRGEAARGEARITCSPGGLAGTAVPGALDRSLARDRRGCGGLSQTVHLCRLQFICPGTAFVERNEKRNGFLLKTDPGFNLSSVNFQILWRLSVRSHLAKIITDKEAGPVCALAPLLLAWLLSSCQADHRHGCRPRTSAREGRAIVHCAKESHGEQTGVAGTSRAGIAPPASRILTTTSVRPSRGLRLRRAQRGCPASAIDLIFEITDPGRDVALLKEIIEVSSAEFI